MLHTSISTDPANASVLARPDVLSLDDFRALPAGSEEGLPMSGLDRAIAAAQTVLPDLRNLDAEMEVLWKALPTSAQRVAARDQARLITPRPDALAFPHAPCKTLVRMELHYADGSTRITDDFDPDFRPTTREQLESHCRQAGLEAEPLLAIWDDWQTRLSQAESVALSPAHRKASEAQDALQAAWNAAHEIRTDLAAAILRGPADDAAPTARQIAAYLEVMEYGSLEAAFDCDDQLLVEAVCRHLAPILRREALRPAWEEARRRYERACEAESAADDADYEATERALRSVQDPLPEAWRHLNGRPVSVLTLDQIAEHRFVFDALPGERGREVQTAVRQYWEDVHRAEVEEQVAAFRFRARRASEARAEMERMLMSTPAPDMSAVAWKVALMLNLQHGLCVDEPEDVEEMLGADGDSRLLANLHADLAGLTGDCWPAAWGESFDAEAWIDGAVEAGADISYGGLAWPEDKVSAAQGFTLNTLSGLRQRRIREALKRRPRQATVDQAVRIYGDESGVAWHGAMELYDTVEICRKRWDLRPAEEVAVRDGLAAAGYVDPFVGTGEEATLQAR